MKNALIADAAGIKGSLGMIELSIRDQEGKTHAFHFLPSGFRQFAAMVAQHELSSIPGELVGIAPIAKSSTAHAQTAARVARSQAGAFAVFAAPIENVAFVSLRQNAEKEAVVTFDADDLGRFIDVLGEALAAIRVAAPGKH